MENAFVESLQGKLRDEHLIMSWFSSLTDACKRIELWRLEYNTETPVVDKNSHAVHWYDLRYKREALVYRVCYVETAADLERHLSK